MSTVRRTTSVHGLGQRDHVRGNDGDEQADAPVYAAHTTAAGRAEQPQQAKYNDKGEYAVPSGAYALEDNVEEREDAHDNRQNVVNHDVHSMWLLTSRNERACVCY